MKRLLQYFLLETKKILLQLPKLLLGSFLLLAVTFFCIFLIRANSAREEKSKPVFIGILAEKEEPFIDWIIKTANNMPDMGYSFHIERIEKKTAENHFFDEDSHVLFIVPKNYISSIIDGKNEHLTIRFSKSQTTIVNTLIKELADAASSYILDTEGAIYSMQDYYKKYHLPNESKDELFLNIKYVQEIIDFTDAIEAVPPDAKRESSVPVVCLSAGIVLAPLILGLILTPVLTSEGQLNKQLIRLRLYIRKQIFVKILVFILTIFIIFFFLALIFSLLQKYSVQKNTAPFLFGTSHFSGTILSKSFGAFSLLFPCMPVFLFAAAFSLFLYELSGDALGGTVLLFFVTLFMALFSGLFYPVSYLPSFFQKTARWIPAACANRYVLGLLYETFDLRSFLCLCLYSSFFYLLTVLALKIRQNKE